jgi:hypothetical protein
MNSEAAYLADLTFNDYKPPVFVGYSDDKG